MNILGINYFFHDSTACIVKDGELLTTLEEERLTRKKHTGDFPHKAIERCLRETGLDYSDIDHIFGITMAVKFEKRSRKIPGGKI